MGSIHSIEVEEGKSYVRLVTGEDKQINWISVDGMADTPRCAVAAHGAGKYLR